LTLIVRLTEGLIRIGFGPVGCTKGARLRQFSSILSALTILVVLLRGKFVFEPCGVLTG